MKAQYTRADLERLHEIETEILREIIRVCEEHDITYYADWGTLLGVVRHGGFIPWDDDVDLSMPRADYLRFLEIAPKALSEGFFLQHFSTEEQTPTYWAKVRRNGTVFVEDYAKNIPIHQGVFVDIYPHDVTADDPKLREKHRKKIAFWQQILIAKDIARITTSRSRLKKLLGGVFRGAVHICLLPVSKKWIFGRLDGAMRCYEGLNSPYTITLDTPTGVRRWDEVFPLQKGTFEGIEVNIPHQSEMLLTRDYGDYMQLPPEEDRVGHCPALFDMGNVR